MSYDVRLLHEDEKSLLDSFLESRTAEAFFIKSNANRGGLAYRGERFQAEYLAAFRGKEIIGIVSYTWTNAIIVYVNNPSCLSYFIRPLIELIRRRDGKTGAILGLADQVDMLIRLLNIPLESFRRNEPEQLYCLNVEELHMPELFSCSDCLVRVARKEDYERLIEWRREYHVAVLKVSLGAQLENNIRCEVNEHIAARDYFLLEKSGQIVSLCGAGGNLFDAVMIAPLWTHPDLRGYGYAKAVTEGALRLLKASNPELKQAILYTATPEAMRVYEALGFKRIGNWRLALLKEGYQYM